MILSERRIVNNKCIKTKFYADEAEGSERIHAYNFCMFEKKWGELPGLTLLDKAINIVSNIYC
jgi:hypothetical protein